MCYIMKGNYCSEAGGISSFFNIVNNVFNVLCSKVDLYPLSESGSSSIE